MKARELGNYVVHFLNNKGDAVSPKKVQKLLYYIESWHLVHLDKPLIDEDFEAWVHGPVVPDVYHNLKEFKHYELQMFSEDDSNKSLEEEFEEMFERNSVSVDQHELIIAVLIKYGSFSSFELEMLTHSEAPWIIARGDTPPNERCTNIILKANMKDYYKAKVA